MPPRKKLTLADLGAATATAAAPPEPVAPPEPATPPPPAPTPPRRMEPQCAGPDRIRAGCLFGTDAGPCRAPWKFWRGCPHASPEE